MQEVLTQMSAAIHMPRSEHRLPETQWPREKFLYCRCSDELWNLDRPWVGAVENNRTGRSRIFYVEKMSQSHVEPHHCNFSLAVHIKAFAFLFNCYCY